MTSISSKTNLIVNYLPASINDDKFREMFAECGVIRNMKVVRDKNTGHSLGYGFVEYEELDHCGEAIKKYNGHKVDNKVLRVTFAKPSNEDPKNTNLYIVGFPVTIDETQIEDIFKVYGSIVSTRLLRKPDTKESRGVAFVRFEKHDDSENALKLMQGKVICGQSCPVGSCSCTTRITIKYALPQKDNKIGVPANAAAASGYSMNPQILPSQYAAYNGGYQAYPYQQASMYTGGSAAAAGGYAGGYQMYPGMSSNYYQNPSQYSYGQIYNGQADATTYPVAGSQANPSIKSTMSSVDNDIGTSVFVFGLNPSCTEQTLIQLFSVYGEIVNIKVVRDMNQPNQPCKGFGFVNFRRHEEAVSAINGLNKYTFDGRVLQVRLKKDKDSSAPSNSTPSQQNSVPSSNFREVVVTA